MIAFSNIILLLISISHFLLPPFHSFLHHSEALFMVLPLFFPFIIQQDQNAVSVDLRTVFIIKHLIYVCFFFNFILIKYLGYQTQLNG